MRWPSTRSINAACTSAPPAARYTPRPTPETVGPPLSVTFRPCFLSRFRRCRDSRHTPRTFAGAGARQRRGAARHQRSGHAALASRRRRIGERAPSHHRGDCRRLARIYHDASARSQLIHTSASTYTGNDFTHLLVFTDRHLEEIHEISYSNGLEDKPLGRTHHQHTRSTVPAFRRRRQIDEDRSCPSGIHPARILHQPRNSYRSRPARLHDPLRDSVYLDPRRHLAGSLSWRRNCYPPARWSTFLLPNHFWRARLGRTLPARRPAACPHPAAKSQRARASALNGRNRHEKEPAAGARQLRKQHQDGLGLARGDRF